MNESLTCRKAARLLAGVVRPMKWEQGPPPSLAWPEGGGPPLPAEG